MKYIIILVVLFFSTNAFADGVRIPGKGGYSQQILEFLVKNSKGPEAFKDYADPDFKQNLYIGNETLEKMWPIWRRAFYPCVNLSVYDDADYYYWSFYNPITDIFFLSKWRKHNLDIKLTSMFAVTGDLIRHESIAPKQIVPPWQRNLNDSTPLDFSSATVETYRWAKSLFGNPEGIELALSAFPKNILTIQEEGHPDINDRDIVVARSLDYSKRMYDAITNDKAFLEQVESCAKGKIEKACSQPYKTYISIEGNVGAELALWRETSAPMGVFKITDGNGFIFVGSTLYTEIVEVVSFQNGYVGRVDYIDFKDVAKKVLRAY